MVVMVAQLLVVELLWFLVVEFFRFFNLVLVGLFVVERLLAVVVKLLYLSGDGGVVSGGGC